MISQSTKKTYTGGAAKRQKSVHGDDEGEVRGKRKGVATDRSEEIKKDIKVSDTKGDADDSELTNLEDGGAFVEGNELVDHRSVGFWSLTFVIFMTKCH